MKRVIKIVLVEVPAVAVETGGKIFGELLLHHMKYAQLLLASNLRLPQECPFELMVDFVDLKSVPDPEYVMYRHIDYDGIPLAVWRVGAPFELLTERAGDADIVGISANFTYERGVTAEVIRVLREKTNAFIVVGGHDATAEPRYYLQQGADLCVLGEGETALAEIAVALRLGHPATVPGTAHMAQGQLTKNGKRQPHDLNGISYINPLTLRSQILQESPDGPLPFGVSPRMAVLETSRGCDERCSFCDSSYIVGKYRATRLQKLMEYLDLLAVADIRTILFADDNLLYRMLPRYSGREGREDLVSFFNELMRRGFAWTFYNGLQFGLLEKDGRVDTELIEALFANALEGDRFRGCFRAYIPLEKFTEPEMMLLPKLRPLPVAKSILTHIAQTGIPQLSLGFIMGNVRETPQTIIETLKQATAFGELVTSASNGCSVPAFFPWCSVPIPGTPDHKAFSPNIVYSASEYPELYTNYISVLANQHFSPSMFTYQREKMSQALNGGLQNAYTIGPHGINLGQVSSR